MHNQILKFTIWISVSACSLSSFAQSQANSLSQFDIESYQVSSNAYILISYTDMKEIGRIGTNHLLYIRNNKAFLFDSPANNVLAGELFQFVSDSLKARIVTVSVSHWHWDHSGGIDTLIKLGVQSYSNLKTKELMLLAGICPAQNTFNDSITINFEGIPIRLAFYGAAHTTDNIIGWIEAEKILFSGSIIRAMDNTNLGYLKDADVNAWPKTLQSIQVRFGNALLIVPGHGKAGNQELFEHTKSLF